MKLSLDDKTVKQMQRKLDNMQKFIDIILGLQATFMGTGYGPHAFRIRISIGFPSSSRSLRITCVKRIGLPQGLQNCREVGVREKLSVPLPSQMRF